MSEAAESKRGLWSSVKRILDTVLGTAQNRIELIAVELQEEKFRLVELILCASAVAAFGMMTLALVFFTIVVLFWENGRIPVLISLCVLCVIGTALAWNALQSRLKSRSAFAGTIAELKRDRACLETDN